MRLGAGLLLPLLLTLVSRSRCCTHRPGQPAPAFPPSSIDGGKESPVGGSAAGEEGAAPEQEAEAEEPQSRVLSGKLHRMLSSPNQDSIPSKVRVHRGCGPANTRRSNAASAGCAATPAAAARAAARGHHRPLPTAKHATLCAPPPHAQVPLLRILREHWATMAIQVAYTAW